MRGIREGDTVLSIEIFITPVKKVISVISILSEISVFKILKWKISFKSTLILNPG